MASEAICNLFGRRSKRPPTILVVTVLAVALVETAGCSYLDKQLARTPTPDPRVQLGWRDRLMLRGSEIPNYTCPPAYLLQCERGGSVTYSCRCALR